MEVRYLVYTGSETDKEIVIRQEPPVSKFRKIRVYPGFRLEIGKDIPKLTADRVISMLSMLFKVEVVDLDDLETFKKQFKEIIEFYAKRFGDDAIAVVPALAVEALFSNLGDNAMESLVMALRESDEIEMEQDEVLKIINTVFGVKRKTVKRRKKE